MTFHELCFDMRVTPTEREALIRFLALLRYEATIAFFARQSSPQSRSATGSVQITTSGSVSLDRAGYVNLDGSPLKPPSSMEKP